jgi:hypothetical protein
VAAFLALLFIGAFLWHRASRKGRLRPRVAALQKCQTIDSVPGKADLIRFLVSQRLASGNQ